jgi:hypothetical protein
MKRLIKIETDNTLFISNVIILAINKLEDEDMNIQQVASSLITAYLLKTGFVFVPEGVPELLTDIIALWEKSNKTKEERLITEELINNIAYQISAVNTVALANVRLEKLQLIEKNMDNEEDIFFWVLKKLNNKINSEKETLQLDQSAVMNRLNVFLNKEQLKSTLSKMTKLLE